MLAAMEAKEGPPKGYMAEEAVQKKQARRLAECSFKTKLDTGKFSPGCLSEKVQKRWAGWRAYPFMSPSLQQSFDP